MKVLVNKGRRRLGIPGRPALILAPNEFAKIDDRQLAEMKKNRTAARWLDTGILVVEDVDDATEIDQVANFTPKPSPPPRARHRTRNRIKTSDKREEVVLPDGLSGKGVETHHVGGGWYQVWVNGFKVTDRNVRKDEAQEMAAEYEE